MERTRTNASRLSAVLVTGLVVGLTIGGITPANAVPAHKLLFGSHVSPRWGLKQQDAIRQLEGMIGRKLAIVNRFQNLSESSVGFATNMSADGRIPMISWRAVDHKELDPNRAAKIANGDFDPQIRAFADAIKGVGRPVLIRFAWEMTQGPGQVQYIGEPADFINAWRHVVSIFRARGAANAKFVWAPRARSFCKGKGQAYYPGDDWVNWIGSSAVPIDTFTSFDELFGCFYGWASLHDKPMMAWVGVPRGAGRRCLEGQLLPGRGDHHRERHAEHACGRVLQLHQRQRRLLGRLERRCLRRIQGDGLQHLVRRPVRLRIGNTGGVRRGNQGRLLVESPRRRRPASAKWPTGHGPSSGYPKCQVICYTGPAM